MGDIVVLQSCWGGFIPKLEHSAQAERWVWAQLWHGPWEAAETVQGGTGVRQTGSLSAIDFFGESWQEDCEHAEKITNYSNCLYCHREKRCSVASWCRNLQYQWIHRDENQEYVSKGAFGTQGWKYHLSPHAVIQCVCQHGDASEVFPGAAFGDGSPGDLLETALLGGLQHQGAPLSFPLC